MADVGGEVYKESAMRAGIEGLPLAEVLGVRAETSAGLRPSGLRIVIAFESLNCLSCYTSQIEMLGELTKQSEVSLMIVAPERYRKIAREMQGSATFLPSTTTLTYFKDSPGAVLFLLVDSDSVVLYAFSPTRGQPQNDVWFFNILQRYSERL
jgi:hypothetical protein